MSSTIGECKSVLTTSIVVRQSTLNDGIKPGVVKFAQGVADNWYREVIHVSMNKIERIKKLLNAGYTKGYELDLSVFARSIP